MMMKMHYVRYGSFFDITYIDCFLILCFFLGGFNLGYLDGLEWQVTLMESMNKRCLFLEHAVGHTGLTNVHVVRGRAEVRGH